MEQNVNEEDGHILHQTASASPATSRAVPDLSQDGWRSNLSDAAIEAMINLADLWRLSPAQAAGLLGATSDEAWFRFRSGLVERPLTEEVLTRISALVGLYKGLHLLFSTPLADEWVRRPNTESLFNGQAPLEAMISGGLEAMLATRAYIDALRGGL